MCLHIIFNKTEKNGFGNLPKLNPLPTITKKEGWVIIREQKYASYAKLNSRKYENVILKITVFLEIWTRSSMANYFVDEIYFM